MCGIIGYVGERNVVPILVDGLKKLEYRGYDSAGICFVNGDKLNIVKKKGRVLELESEVGRMSGKGNIGVAHTRWATHGEPNMLNAHPHVSSNGEIVIVHNGIIENHQALREILKREGYNIVSKTDSEVLAHLIQKFYNGDLTDAVIKALRLVEGAFGLVVMHEKENKLVAVRRGSPLILGIGENEMFVASDVPAVLNNTRKVIYLDDNEIADVYVNGYKVQKLNGESVDKEIEDIKWSINEVEKKGFKHFMLKEIFEQPDSLANTIRGRIKDKKIKLSVDIDISNIKRIILVACGTSWHSALIGKYIIEEVARIPTDVDYASEFRYRNPIINSHDLVVLISQSGETADTLAVLQEAKRKGARTLGLVNVVGSSIARGVDSGIYLHAGPEIGVASTKAFTCQVMALILFALNLRQAGGKAISERLLREIISIPVIIGEVLGNVSGVRYIAEKFADSSNFLFLGRGIDFPVALEGALKLKEISYIHAEGYPAAEMKHGPIALIDENMPVVFLATKNHLSGKTLSNMEEVRARKGNIIAIVNDREDVKELADFVIKVPKVSEILSPIVNVIPLQLLSYYIADFKGLDVDKPRNLAKSVTVE